MEETNYTSAEEHRAEASGHLSSIGKRLFRFVEFDEDEQLISEIRKHPVGIIFLALGGILLVLAVIAAVILMGPVIDNLNLAEGSDSLKLIVTLVGLLVGLAILVITAISIVLYRLNVIFVTNEKIAEVAYISIFNRKVTQLNIGKVEDVTVQKRGILAHIFNYGSMLVETAGETVNPSFTMVPNPDVPSQQIIEAHERYVEKYGN